MDSEAKELVRLCRAGKLYEIEEWINAGKSLDISAAMNRGRQRSLLEIAVEIGFHSLVELIAKREISQSAKDAALRDAVSLRRLDLVELLLANGADIKSVSLADALLTWEPTLIRGVAQTCRFLACLRPAIPTDAYMPTGTVGTYAPPSGYHSSSGEHLTWLDRGLARCPARYGNCNVSAAELCSRRVNATARDAIRSRVSMKEFQLSTEVELATTRIVLRSSAAAALWTSPIEPSCKVALYFSWSDLC